MGFLTRGAVKYAATKQAVQSGNFNPMPIDAGREQDSPSPYALAAIQLRAITRICGEKRLDAAGHSNLRSEVTRLLDGTPRELIAGDARRKSQIVFNPGGGACLSAGSRAFDNQDPQPLRRTIDSSRHPGRPRAGDENVIVLVFWSGLEPQRLRNRTNRRSQQLHRTIHEHSDSLIPRRNAGGSALRRKLAIH